MANSSSNLVNNLAEGIHKDNGKIAIAFLDTKM